MLAVPSRAFSLINHDDEVNGLVFALGMIRGKNNIKVIGRVPLSLKNNNKYSMVDWRSMDDDKWKKESLDVIILSSLNEMIIEKGDHTVIKDIIDLTRSCCVIGIVNRGIINELSISRLMSISDKSIILIRRDEKVEARMRTFKKNGLVQEEMTLVSMNDNGSLREEIKKIDKVDDESEKIIKVEKIEVKKVNTNMELPFESAKSEEGLVSIHKGKVRVGGRVIYSADDADDLDDSDPDDDLNI